LIFFVLSNATVGCVAFWNVRNINVGKNGGGVLTGKGNKKRRNLGQKTVRRVACEKRENKSKSKRRGKSVIQIQGEVGIRGEGRDKKGIT